MVAELGKAHYVSVNDVQTGMKVHRDVMGRRGIPLVMAGEVLTHRHVEKLRKWEAREKPIGPALPKRDHKNTYERVQHGEFKGGYKVSHFNPQGILVSATLASGAENPEVERNVEKSPFFQGQHVKSHNVNVGLESPLFRMRDLESGIKSLKAMNEQLGGIVHQNIPEQNEEGLSSFRDLLKQENERLIEGLKAGSVNEKDTPAATSRKSKVKKPR